MSHAFGGKTRVKSIDCAAPNADWTVISNCAELLLIPAQLFPVGFSCAELTLIPAQSFPVGFSCAEKLYNCTTFQHTKNRLEMTVQELKLILHTKKTTGNNCAGIKSNSAQLEITVQSAFGAAQVY